MGTRPAVSITAGEDFDTVRVIPQWESDLNRAVVEYLKVNSSVGPVYEYPGDLYENTPDLVFIPVPGEVQFTSSVVSKDPILRVVTLTAERDAIGNSNTAILYTNDIFGHPNDAVVLKTGEYREVEFKDERGETRKYLALMSAYGFLLLKEDESLYKYGNGNLMVVSSEIGYRLKSRSQMIGKIRASAPDGYTNSPRVPIGLPKKTN